MRTRSNSKRPWINLSPLLLALPASLAQAQITLYTDLAEFNAATNNAAELFQTTAENVFLADEVTTLPTRNVAVGAQKADGEGRTLTFQRANTGLFYSFEFTSLQAGNGSLTFDDDEGSGDVPSFNNALSPGDIDNLENDDWRIRLVGNSVFRPMRAFGFLLRDNGDSTGEFIRLYDSAGNLVHAVPVGAQASGDVFLGVVSDEPFSEIRYDEDPGGDDIAVADFRFVAIPDPAPTAVDVFAATPVSTAQNPQSTTVILEGSDVTDDPLTYSILGSPANGTLRDAGDGNAVVSNGPISGNTLLYTPDNGFTGTDQFTYRVNDGTSNSEIKLATISVFQSYRAQARQLGADIDGEAAADLSGVSVALSRDGQTVAIGALFNDGNGSNAGHVRLYRWNGVSWAQLGSDIDGEAAGDEAGYSVALSSDGQTVAIGAAFNDGNGSNAGHVRLYRWNGASWAQLGSDIDGEAAGEFSGTSVSLSSDGQTVAIGAPLNDGDEPDSGRVRLYDLTLSGDEDDDKDGVDNDADTCDSTPPGEVGQIDASGCAPSERDTDNDGVNDALDAFPEDPTETADSDGDGLGDNREATLGTNPNLEDSDGDGFSDLDEVEAESDPLSADDIPNLGGLNIILIKAAIDAKAS